MLIKVTDTMLNKKSYDGNTLKFGVTINGKDYIVKLAKQGQNVAKSRFDTSVYSEHIASTFIRKLGIACQTTYLGEYKGQPCVLMQDFTQQRDGMVLHTYKSIRQTSLDTDFSSKEYTYTDVIAVIKNDNKLSQEQKSKAIKQFWVMFVCDAILGNRDRHQGNWGFVVYKNQHYVAPIFDNGASLFPQVSQNLDKMVENPKLFFKDRVYKYPASVFKIRRNGSRGEDIYKTNYYEMLSDLRVNKTLAEVVKQFRNIGVEKIDIIIKDILQDMPITPLLKQFYRGIILLRYLCLVCRVDYDTSFEILKVKGVFS